MVQTVKQPEAQPVPYTVARAMWWQGAALDVGATVQVADRTLAAELVACGRLVPVAQDAAPPVAEAAATTERTPRRATRAAAA